MTTQEALLIFLDDNRIEYNLCDDFGPTAFHGGDPPLPIIRCNRTSLVIDRNDNICAYDRTIKEDLEGHITTIFVFKKFTHVADPDCFDKVLEWLND